MHTGGWIRVCAVFALCICLLALLVNLNYMLHGKTREFLAMGSAWSAWLVMLWCAGLLLAGVALLLLLPWARNWVIGLLCVYIAYFLLGWGGAAVTQHQPSLLLPALVPTVGPLVCVWYLSRFSVKAGMAARVRPTSASS